jgi:hypothetical protein
MFHKRAESRDGLRVMCKDCAKEYNRIYNAKPENKEKARVRERLYRQKLDLKRFEWVDDIVGGYKIFILNYPKKGEFKFNIVPTRGDVFSTNSKQDFIQYLEGI